MSDTPLLDASEKHIHKLLENAGGDPARLDPVIQPVAYLSTGQALIDNGGFQYFF